MPYGISPATAKFQRALEQLFQGMDNVTNFIDDILITGKDDQEHLETLDKVLKKLSDAGLTVKWEKCKFMQEEIEYLGHNISKIGLKKTNEKVKAIQQAPPPISVSEVRSFVGLVNYYSKFIPNLATKLKSIYELLKKDINFNWSDKCMQAFNSIKQEIANDIVLVHFNPNLPLILTADASSYGIGATLSMIKDGMERPVACVSRTLMPPEVKYASICREALAIIYGVKKFEQYLIGHKFILRTDHKPLVHIFGEHKEIPRTYASRLQRWALYLASFNYSMEYIRGRDNIMADFLSRAPMSITVIDPEFEGKGEMLNFVKTNADWPIDNKQVERETEADEQQNKVKSFILKEDWPKNIEDGLKPYWRKKDEIVVSGNILLYGHRVIIPNSLRKTLLNELHTSHLGMAKTKSLARSYLWWPNIDQDIEESIRSCQPRLLQRPSPEKSELTSWEPESKVWNRVHADYLGPIKGTMFLILIDSYSKFPEVYPVRNMSAEVTEEKFRDSFARMGLSQVLVTDNGTQFVSQRISKFLAKNGIKHVTTTVGHPQSNGQAEIAVKVFKKKMYAALADEENYNEPLSTFSRFLLTFRTTVHETTKETPAQIMFGRSLRIRFDWLKNNEIDIPTKVTINIKNSQIKQKEHYSKGKCGKFKIDEKVMVRDFRKVNVKSWTPAKIYKKIGRSTYLCELEEGKIIWKRHLNQIITREEKYNTDKKIQDGRQIQTEGRRVIASKIAYNSDENKNENNTGSDKNSLNENEQITSVDNDNVTCDKLVSNQDLDSSDSDESYSSLNSEVDELSKTSIFFRSEEEISTREPQQHEGCEVSKPEQNPEGVYTDPHSAVRVRRPRNTPVRFQDYILEEP